MNAHVVGTKSYFQPAISRFVPVQCQKLTCQAWPTKLPLDQSKHAKSYWFKPDTTWSKSPVADSENRESTKLCDKGYVGHAAGVARPSRWEMAAQGVVITDVRTASGLRELSSSSKTYHPRVATDKFSQRTKARVNHESFYANPQLYGQKCRPALLDCGLLERDYSDTNVRWHSPLGGGCSGISRLLAHTELHVDFTV